MSKHDPNEHDASKKAGSGASTDHRLFHAIVLMGSSMALGCGGTVTDGTAPDDPSDGGSNGSGSSGSGSSGSGSSGSGSSGSGSSGSGSGSGGRATSGGAPGAGGYLPPQAGGATSAAGGGMVTPPLPCPPTQWRCNADTLRCDYNVRGYELPTDCVCDPDLPVDEKACGPGRILTCNLAVSLPAGPPLDERVAFGCTCRDESEACDLACQGVRGGEERACVEERELNGMVQYLCGCAVIVLR